MIDALNRDGSLNIVAVLKEELRVGRRLGLGDCSILVYADRLEWFCRTVREVRLCRLRTCCG